MASLAQMLNSRDRVFQDLFTSFAATVVSATEHLHEMLEHYPDRREDLLAQIVDCERAGDETLHEIRARLNQTFVTPIDREDILALGSAMDDIIDYTEEAADYLGLYGIEAPMEQSQQLAAILVAAARALQRAVPSVRDFSDASEAIHEVHKLENDGDRLSRDAIASLFHNGIDPMVVIRWKDMFAVLEKAIDATETAAHILEGIVIKNS